MLRSLAFTALLSGAASAPHVVFFMVDDWGWGDAGYHRNETQEIKPKLEISTPHIDSLVRAGVELNRHYTYRWCTPSRSSFLSGRLPVHVFEGKHFPGACNQFFGVPRNMTTVAAKLKSRGYRTHQVSDPQVHTPGRSIKFCAWWCWSAF